MIHWYATITCSKNSCLFILLHAVYFSSLLDFQNPVRFYFERRSCREESGRQNRLRPCHLLASLCEKVAARTASLGLVPLSRVWQLRVCSDLACSHEVAQFETVRKQSSKGRWCARVGGRTGSVCEVRKLRKAASKIIQAQLVKPESYKA